MLVATRKRPIETAAIAVELHESVLSPPDKVDRELGVIRGVKVIGRVSKNGYEYSDKALDEAARLYEGVKVNVDHLPRALVKSDRPFGDFFGELRDVVRKGDSAFADLHFLKSHPLAEQVCESAERFPLQFGLSHHASGTERTRRGKPVIESVTAVRSVDIVGKPATNAGLFESEATPRNRPMKTTLRKLIESFGSPYYAKNLEEMDSADGYAGMADSAVTMPDAAEGAEPTPEDQLDAALKSMVTAVLDDSSLDARGKAKKISQILVGFEKIEEGKDAPSGDAGSETASTETAESEKGKKPAAGMIELTEEQRAAAQKAREDHATELLEAAGVKPSKPQIKALAALDNTADRKALIESWKPQKAPVPKPAFSRPITVAESEDDDAKMPTGKDLLAAVR